MSGLYKRHVSRIGAYPTLGLLTLRRDLWEARWSDRIRLAAEESRKSNLDFKSRCEVILADKDRAIEDIARAMRERDEAWVTQLVSRHPDLSHEVHAILETLDRIQGTNSEGASKNERCP